LQIHKKWTDCEKESIKNDYGVLLPIELEEKYQRKYRDIRAFCARNKIKSHRNVTIRKWTEQELSDFIIDWKENILTKEELEIKYNRQYNSLSGKAKDLKLNRITSVDRITSDNIREIIDLYQNKNNSARQIAEMYKTSGSSILTILKNENIQIRDQSHCKRNYNINEKYFDVIDLPEKAYWLGFLYADGSNFEERNYVSLTLKEEDRYILEKLKNDLKSEQPIIEIHNKQFNKIYPNLTIKNKNISEQLKNKGIVQNKTFICRFPNWLEEKYYPDFIRGLFDGDGCISIGHKKQNNYLYFSIDLINGNYDFMTRIENILNNKSNMSHKKIYLHNNIFRIGYSKMDDIHKFYKYIYYNDKDFHYLKRKKDKFELFLSYIKERGFYDDLQKCINN
jgi:hypothetical protein